MKRHGWFAGSVGVLVLSAGLILMTDSASYGSGTKSWDTKYPSATRFVVLAAFANTAVLDRETSLVWEQSPATVTNTWENDIAVCANKNVGGRKGWRLPSFAELATLVDPSQSSPALPAGHPFINVQSGRYWAATTFAVNPTAAWGVDFNGGGSVGLDNKVGIYPAWCVRGGMNADAH